VSKSAVRPGKQNQTESVRSLAHSELTKAKFIPEREQATWQSWPVRRIRTRFPRAGINPPPSTVRYEHYDQVEDGPPGLLDANKLGAKLFGHLNDRFRRDGEEVPLGRIIDRRDDDEVGEQKHKTPRATGYVCGCGAARECGESECSGCKAKHQMVAERGHCSVKFEHWPYRPKNKELTPKARKDRRRVNAPLDVESVIPQKPGEWTEKQIAARHAKAIAFRRANDPRANKIQDLPKLQDYDKVRELDRISLANLPEAREQSAACAWLDLCEALDLPLQYLECLEKVARKIPAGQGLRRRLLVATIQLVEKAG
jgi:hypothetical protein